MSFVGYLLQPYTYIPLFLIIVICYVKRDTVKPFLPFILTVSAIVLIYGYIEYSSYSNNEKEFIEEDKPYISECPDYWTVLGDNKCKRNHNVGFRNCDPGPGHARVKEDIVDFSDSIYVGKGGNKNKCEWAKKCKTTWDGIDNLCN